MAGDITMVAPRRFLAQTMSGFRDRVYSYRWDVAAQNSSSTIGVQHFAEVRIYSLSFLYLLCSDELRHGCLDPIRFCQSRPDNYTSRL
jgi:hypothetical protein